MKKSIVVMFGLIYSLMLVVNAWSFDEDNIPPTGKLVVAGSDPEIIIEPARDGSSIMFFPVTKGQQEEQPACKNATWTMNASVARYRGDEWILKAEDNDQYQLPTNTVEDVIGTSYKLPTEGHDWLRMWGKYSGGWWFIPQSSKYYRLGQTGKPGIEFLIGPDGIPHVVPQNYPLRP